MPHILVGKVAQYASGIFKALGLPENDAEVVVDNLLFADLRGVPSHGMSRVPTYVKRIKGGAINPNPNIRAIIERPALTVLDADGGMGQVAAMDAINQSIDAAKREGISTVFVRNSNHFGMASYYTRIAASKGMVAVAVSNAPPAMAAWGGSKPVLGTNPLSLAFPNPQGDPIIIDMATSLAARGKIREAEKEGRSIPLGWALDKEGNPTTDPKEALAGSLSPLGGVKGYALAVAVELLSGVLSGAGFLTGIEQMVGGSTGSLSVEQRVGHSFVVIDAGTLLPIEELTSRMTIFEKIIKEGPKAERVQEIFLPGQIEALKEKEQLAKGLYLSNQTITALNEIGDQLSLGALY
ncbi:Ldh family oxidoreductase [Tepidibacillus sp. HK-1]|uniref:Ldh family oxidoreductase n=1 Tax=Tepidibacillus sp. HK-1 TaxID=1883407 RepID=UPI000852DC39|nr:Ldh family oxidoreductase [Tepidibacillus sp. HK-1]GBF12236.1 putative oxidoreductase YjmC [Tepidibacillus sp. HK-1]